MDNLDRLMEFVVAGVFMWSGLSKIFAYKRSVNLLGVVPSRGLLGLPHRWVIAIGLFEIAAALALATPIGPWPPVYVVRIAAAALALLTMGASIYRVRHHQPAAPALALFFMAIFVVVGRSM